MKHMRKIWILASMALLGCALAAGCGGKKEQTPTTEMDVPVVSGKQPGEYTWAEFEALSAEQQMAFQNALGAEAFEAWLNQAQNPVEPNPWDQPGARQPADYTWEEFEALTGAQQMAFQNSFESQEAFNAWLEEHLPQETKPAMPWDNGGKQPSDYTWAEFEALTGEQQMAFQSSFASFAEFDAWLQRGNP